ncbi:MAG: F0F1 ATP synthase subunit B [Burkholderiales bacterium]|nr:F0F1 ATP synthase subunit B [Burkholderiales bacterium]
MNINATLLGQTIMFVMFVWFCMKFIWPPITNAMGERAKRIADGLAAGERGKSELDLATKRSLEILHDAKQKATEVIAQAESRASQIVEEAKTDAKKEGERLLTGAKAEIEQEVFRARETLRDQVAALAVAGAEKILRQEVDAGKHAELLKSIQAEL